MSSVDDTGYFSLEVGCSHDCVNGSHLALAPGAQGRAHFSERHLRPGMIDEIARLVGVCVRLLRPCLPV